MSKPPDPLWSADGPALAGPASFRVAGAQIESLGESRGRGVHESSLDPAPRNSVRHGGGVPAVWARPAGRDTRLLGLTHNVVRTPLPIEG